MSGFWLKWEKGLTRKPEILKLAARLMIPATQAAGTLMLVMEWLDDSVTEFTEDGHADVTLGSLPYTFIDGIAGVSGTADALIEVGWLRVNGDVLRFVNVGRHNGKSGKARALATDRKRKERSRNGHDKSVTMSRSLCSVSVSESEGVKGDRKPSAAAIAAVYDAYPRKTARPVALRAIEKAARTKPIHTLLERTELYRSIVATWPPGDERFVPHPATWFNQGRYDDEPETWKRIGPPGLNGHTQAPLPLDANSSCSNLRTPIPQ